MKRAVILHGTDGSPETNWYPWIKQKLQEQGYEVWVPELPDNHTPNRQVYNEFLFRAGWDFGDNIVIGHSSGAVSVLNMLMDRRCPRIRLGVMVGAWASGMPQGNDDHEQFGQLFPPHGFEFARIKSQADKLVFLHGDDDPYCPLAQAEWLAQQLDSQIVIVPQGHHLGRKFTELPELWEIVGYNL